MKTVFETEWFTVEAADLGEDRPYYRILQPDNAVVLPFTDSGDMVLVRQFRWAINRWTVEPPAGFVEANENPADAARREMMEETGYTVAQLLPLGQLWMYSNRMANTSNFFIGTGAQVSRQKTEAGTEIVLVNKERFRDLCRSDEIQHAAIFAILKAAEIKLGFHWI